MGDKMEQFFKLGVSVTGIKKRCRKAEHHYISGGYLPYNDGAFNSDEVESLVKGIIETNMKQVNGKIYIVLNHVKRADGIETWEMFGKTNVKYELKSSLENALQ
jgi:hypothetical protein